MLMAIGRASSAGHYLPSLARQENRLSQTSGTRLFVHVQLLYLAGMYVFDITGAPAVALTDGLALRVLLMEGFYFYHYVVWGLSIRLPYVAYDAVGPLSTPLLHYAGLYGLDVTDVTAALAVAPINGQALRLKPIGSP
jgi:hypothetical protein